MRKVVTSLGSDFSRSYLFAISIPTLNEGRDNYYGDNYFDSKKLTVFARSFDLPSYVLKVKPIEFQTMQIQVVEGIQFSHTWNVEFISDDTNVLRGKLLRWSNLAYDFNRKAAATPTSYKRKAIASQLDRNGNIIANYTFNGLFPRKIDGYNVSHDNVNMAKFGVEFRYDYYNVEILPYKKNSSEQSSLTGGESDLRSAAPMQMRSGNFLGSQGILPA